MPRQTKTVSGGGGITEADKMPRPAKGQSVFPFRLEANALQQRQEHQSGAMHLHEFQAKALLARYGVRTPIGRFATSPDEARDAARQIGAASFVVKAQLHINNRRQQGAIASARDPDEVTSIARRMLASTISGDRPDEAATIRGFLIEEEIGPHQELFIAVTLAPSAGEIRLLAGPHEARLALDPSTQLSTADLNTLSRQPEPAAKAGIEQIRIDVQNRKAVADFAGLAGRLSDDLNIVARLTKLFEGLAAAFLALDARVLELSPLAILPDGRLYALDAKVIVDDNALPRQPELAEKRRRNAAGLDHSAETERESEADRFNINLIHLAGDIAVIANGAGLALATLDAVVDAGGTPADFMDIRTTASSVDIARGLSLILRDQRVRSVLVNIHGGGMQRCDTVAEGIGIAARHVGRKVPLVIRMAGNNAEFAATVLRNNGIEYRLANRIDDAARLSVLAANRKAA